MTKTPSPKQIDANRRNAQKSTGPKTPAGQAISKMNALKHGILSLQVVVHGRCIKESDAEFSALHQRFLEDSNPVGVREEMLVDQIVTLHWRLGRVLTAESAEIVLSVDWTSDCPERERAKEKALRAAAVLPSPEVLDKILRYETTLRRYLDRAMIQLERLQRMRQGLAVPPPLTIQVSEAIEPSLAFLPNEPKFPASAAVAADVKPAKFIP